jgi:hypothetical protein
MVAVFGLISLLLLVLGIWTHLDMKRKERQEKSDADAKSNHLP